MRRGEPLPRAFQAPVDVHASADGQVYMFMNREEDALSEDEELNVMELRPRSREVSSQERERERVGDLMLLERDISHGDNLNKLALQYGCKVADIKRVNNLIQEQDLYALKSIKIPVKKYGLLTEANAELKEPQPRSSSSPSPTSAALSPSPIPQAQEYTDFLREVDNDIERLIQSTDGPEEVYPGRSEGLRLGSRGQRLGSYGADWGIQWWNAVVAMLLIGIVLPIFYMVYFKTRNHGTSGMEDNVVNVSLTTSDNSTASLRMTDAKSTLHMDNSQT
ncbi:lysM and putative peptidoglycan-binding domain-containing protein 4 [Chanos chanos]|uniref:LysM and putative peptidoglycan-binding domain-containing protein 4 n=1 Tax=Chanos chanos TaxID=29144 RepID=A0A6J2UQK2_CHACN|nr:lysM and putative peptidoglycan-binding domain-containing protein 4 [Chanos chanos]